MFTGKEEPDGAHTYGHNPLATQVTYMTWASTAALESEGNISDDVNLVSCVAIC